MSIKVANTPSLLGRLGKDAGRRPAIQRVSNRYTMILIFLCIFFNTDFIAEEMFQTLYQKIWTLRLIAI